MQIEIVVAYNREDILRRVFLRSRGLEKAKLFLIENDKTSRALPEIFNAHKRNSSADWLVFCHQDFIVFDPRWLDKFSEIEPNACYGPIGIDGTGNFKGQIRQTDGRLLGQLAPLIEVSSLDEMCLIVPRRVFGDVDFDERFSFDFYVCDFCLRAKQLGYPSRILQLDCQHKSRSLKGDIKSERYLSAKRLFVEKYKEVRPLLTTTFQIWPRYWAPVEKNSTLMTELEMVGTGKTVLEIGPGSGHVTEELANRGCTVTTIERDPNLTTKARSFCQRLIIGDVEQLDLKMEFPRERFDVILLGDVLEHLKDPGIVLRNLREHLKPSGYLVVSLPNVAHASVRLALVNGDFNYTDEGLLDRTHLKFFTLDTIVTLLRDAGYQIRELRRTRVGFFNTEVKLSIEHVAVSLLRKLIRDPEAATYQFIFSAVVNKENVCGQMAEPDASSLSVQNWSTRRERNRMARSLMRRGRSLLHEDGCREARAWLYRSFMLKPRIQTLLYLWLACFPISRLRAFRPRR